MHRFSNRPVSFRAFSHSAHKLFDQIPQTNLTQFSNKISHKNTPKKSAHKPADPNPQNALRPFLTDPISFSKTLTYHHLSSKFIIHNFHGLAIVSGLICELPVSNSLINSYSKLGYSYSALKLFQTAPNRDTISWNTVISSLDCINQAMGFLIQMLREGFCLDTITLIAILSFSLEFRDFLTGLQIHSIALKTGFFSDRFVSNKLITFYSCAGFLQDAQKIFDEMIFKDLVSFNALICGFAQNGGNNGFEANHLFVKMLSKKDKIRPDRITIASILPVCGLINLGRQIHCFSTKIGVSDDLSVCNVLISMYYKYGEINSARNVFNYMRFRDVVSWTSMISMDSNNAVWLFNEMILDGIKPNLVTFVALIFAIPNNYSVRNGCMVHSLSYKLGLFNKINVSNSLITMYARLGQMDYAQKLFDEMNEREIITWNALLSGYQQNGFYEKALEIFASLISCLKPNQYTFGSILSAITGAETLSLTYGQMCHCYIVKLGFNTNEFVSSALIDMYAKQGHLEDSDKLFNEREKRSIISWTAVISAHAKHGNYQKVMDLFENMVKNYKITPDGFILLSVLMVCGSKGMVQKGEKIFNSIFHEYKIDPWPEHYSCMVDMLGKANKIQEAEHLMHLMPGGPSLSALQSLLNACRIHGNTETGQRVAEILLKMDFKDSGAFVSISNVFAERGEWEKVARVRKGMREKGVRKEIGFSWVDLGFLDNNLRVYKFASDDNGHPFVKEIYEIVESLGTEMKILREDLDVEMDLGFD